MDNSIVIALIAATASLLVAALSLITALVTSRASTSNASAIERVKQSISDAARAATVADTHLLDSTNALRRGMQAIQSMKDEILLTLDAIEDSLPASEAVSRSLKARDALIGAFESTHPDLEDNEAHAFHRAKSIAIKACTLIQQDLSGRKNASQLSAVARTALLESRSLLTDQQNLLRDARADRIFERTLTTKR